MTEKKQDQDQTRFGAVALIGFTNAGKSSLINHMLGMKLAIVTPKVQTTRYKQSFIVQHEQAQIMFFDTPGIFNPENFFERQLITMMEESIEVADELVYVLDSKRFDKHDHVKELKKLLKHNKPVSICFNKTDLVKKDILLPMVAGLIGHKDLEGRIHQVFFSSIKDSKGTRALLDYLSGHLPVGPFHYDDDMVTDYSMRQVFAEITREKVLQFCHQEIPYHCHIITEEFTENLDKNQIHVAQKILVRRKTHKGIMIGKQGAHLKRIGTEARHDMETISGMKVMLSLYVSVESNWPDRTNIEEDFV